MNEAEKRGDRRRNAYAVALLGLIVAVFYFPAAGAGFVWDDVIITEAAVRFQLGVGSAGSGLTPSPPTFKRDVAENHYWPIVYTTFWIEHKLWGFAPAGYHVVNILLHFANAVLLWRLLVRLAVPGAWVAAAVFAAHPLHVESVAWVIGRKDLLSALFYLSAVSMWLRHVESPRPGLYAAALLLFLAAMLSKSIAITLPATLLIIQWWKRGRVTRADVLLALPFFLLALVVGGADFWFYKSQGLHSFDYSVAERALAASRALWFYVGKLLWPAGLTVIYPLWEIKVADPLAWGYLAVAVAAVAGLFALRRRVGRGPLACVLFFGVTLLPTLGFVDYNFMRYSFVADRYQYLAGIGVIVLFAAALRGAKRRLPAARGAVKIAVAAVLVALGSLTWIQSGIYKDELTFFNHVISLNPRARGAHYNAGLELFRQGRTGEAERYFRRAIEIYPRDTKSLHNLGEILRAGGKYEESLEFYRLVIEMEPGHARALFGMGSSLFELGRYTEAVSTMERVLVVATDPSVVPASHYIMGKALLKMGRGEEAEVQFDLGMKSSLRMNPRGAEAFLTWAEVLREQKRYGEALQWYRFAIEEEPDNALAYAGIGDSLYRLGRYREAISSMERAVSLGHGSSITPTLYYLMGEAAREAGWPEEAATHYKRALLVAPRFKEALGQLADLHFEQGRYAPALSLYRALLGTGYESAMIHHKVGVSLLNTGKASEAVGSFKRALDLEPSLESARIGLKRARESVSRADE